MTQRIRAQVLCLCFSAFAVDACCCTLKTSVRDEATSIRVTTEPAIVAIDRCSNGEKEACDLVKQNLTAIRDSAAKLESDAK